MIRYKTWQSRNLKTQLLKPIAFIYVQKLNPSKLSRPHGPLKKNPSLVYGMEDKHEWLYIVRDYIFNSNKLRAPELSEATVGAKIPPGWESHVTFRQRLRSLSRDFFKIKVCQKISYSVIINLHSLFFDSLTSLKT